MGDRVNPRKRVLLDDGAEAADSIGVSFVRSKVGIKKYCFHWELQNFETLIQSPELLYLSTRLPFSVKNDAGVETSWIMQMIRAQDENKEWWMSLRTTLDGINVSDPKMKPVYCSVKVATCDKKENIIKSCDGVTGFQPKDSSLTFILPIATNPEDMKLIDGSLYLEVEMELYTTSSTLVTPIGTIHQKNGMLESVRDNLVAAVASLRNYPQSGDVTIMSQEGQRFKAHSFVLTSLSPFLKNQLETAPEGIDVFKCSALSSAGLKCLLDFMYTGVLPEESLNPDLMCELIGTASRFQMDDLVRLLLAFSKKFSGLDLTTKLLEVSEKVGLSSTEQTEFIQLFKDGLESELDAVNSVEDYLKFVGKLKTL